MTNTIRLVILAFCALAAAQAQFDSGQIAGFVRDPSQATIAGANVTVTNEGNGQKHRTTTNSTGYYVVPNLFVGTYTVEVETAGFKKAVQSGIQLSSAAKLSIDIELIADVFLDLPGGPEKIGPGEGVGLGEGLGVLHGDLDFQVA